MQKFLLVLFFSACNVFVLTAQLSTESLALKPETKRNIFSIHAGVNDGFIFAHSKDVTNSKGSRPLGVELGFSWLKNDTLSRNICNCFPKNGLVLSYYNLDIPVFGKSYSASYLIEPLYRVSNSILFSIKGLIGAAYLTNPYDSIHNPTNRSYSTAINAYLTLGVGLWFKLSDKWWLNGTLNFQHVSNGGMKMPNSGINWPTAGILLSHQNLPMPRFHGSRQKERYWNDYSVRWDMSLFGMMTKVIDKGGNKHFYPIIGTGFQGSKQVGTINALTLSAEIFTDQESKHELIKDSIYIGSLRAGLMIGHEFLLGKFLFSQRLGVYIINETNYPSLFHRWGLQYRLNRHWGIGFNLLAHGRTADFYDIRFSYSWQKRGGRQ